MAWYNSLSDLGHDIGSVASNPIVDAGLSFIPGVGPIAAAGIGALGGALKPGGNLGSAIQGGVTGGLAGGGAQSIAGLLGMGGGGGGASAGGSPAIPDSAMGLPGAAPGAGAAGGAPTGIAGLLSGAEGFLGGNGGKTALGVAQGINAALQQKQANDYAKQALGSVEGSYSQRAPLRAQGIAGMLGSQQGNPYATGNTNAPMTMGRG